MEVIDAIGVAKGELQRKLITNIDVFSLDTELVLDDGSNRAKGAPEDIIEILRSASDARTVWSQCEKSGLTWPHCDKDA